jgi:hypothetical protein
MPRNRTYLSTSTATAPARPKSSRAARCAYLLLWGLSAALGTTTVSAEELSVDEMICALDPQCAMPVGRTVRGITATSTEARTPGSFENHSINFEFNSAQLTAAARRELDRIALALTDPSVAKYTIIIHGHTDGVGRAEYNQVLSERRAAATRQYFITRHRIDPNNWLALPWLLWLSLKRKLHNSPHMCSNRLCMYNSPSIGPQFIAPRSRYLEPSTQIANRHFRTALLGAVSAANRHKAPRFRGNSRPSVNPR